MLPFMVLTFLFLKIIFKTNIPGTICEQRLTFYMLGQVISAMPASCQNITKLNEMDSMEMVALPCLAKCSFLALCALSHKPMECSTFLLKQGKRDSETWSLVLLKH